MGRGRQTTIIPPNWWKTMGSLFCCPPSIQVFFTHIIGRSLNFCWSKHCYFPTLAPCVGGSIFIGQILIISQPPSLLWHCCLLLSAWYFHISNFYILYFPEPKFVISQPPSRLWPCCPLLAPATWSSGNFPCCLHKHTFVPHSHNTTLTPTTQSYIP